MSFTEKVSSSPVQNSDDFIYAAYGSTDHFCSYITVEINI